MKFFFESHMKNIKFQLRVSAYCPYLPYKRFQHPYYFRMLFVILISKNNIYFFWSLGRTYIWNCFRLNLCILISSGGFQLSQSKYPSVPSKYGIQKKNDISNLWNDFLLLCVDGTRSLFSAARAGFRAGAAPRGPYK